MRRPRAGCDTATAITAIPGDSFGQLLSSVAEPESGRLNPVSDPEPTQPSAAGGCEVSYTWMPEPEPETPTDDAEAAAPTSLCARLAAVSYHPHAWPLGFSGT